MSLKTARCDSRDLYDLHDREWSAIGAIPRHSCIRVIRAGLVIHAIHVTGVMRTFYENQRWAHSRSRAPGTWRSPAAGIRIMARQPWVASLRIVCVVEALTRRLPHTLCDAGRMLANRLTAPQRNATRRDCQPSKPFVDGCATNRGTGEVAMRGMRVCWESCAHDAVSQNSSGFQPARLEARTAMASLK